MGGFCPGGFCPRGDFVQGDFVRGILSGGVCPGGFCPRTLETICWEIRVYAGCFLKGVILAQCYGIILWFQGNGTRGSVEHPGSADLSRTM